MKTIITMSLILMLLSSTVSAAALKDCTAYAEFAETVMRVRQDNRDMIKVLKVIEKYDPESKRWMELVITGAYDKPLFSSLKYKQRSIMEYKNAVFNNCYKK